MKIAVIGGGGLLGSEIFSYLLSKRLEVISLSHCDIEISDMETFVNAFDNF